MLCTSPSSALLGASNLQALNLELASSLDLGKREPVQVQGRQSARNKSYLEPSTTSAYDTIMLYRVSFQSEIDQ